MTFTRKSLAIIFALLVLVVGATTTTAALANQEDDAKADEGKHYGKAKTVKFDVAENTKQAVVDGKPVDENSLPAYGASFITQGYIYPEGTLDESNGVKANGEPEFPEKVIGEWTCRGWLIGEGVSTETEPWVSSTQLYDLGNKPGKVTLVTEGSELIDVGVPIKRAVVDGTGPHKKASGEQAQKLLGFNETEGEPASRVQGRQALDTSIRDRLCTDGPKFRPT